MAETNKKPVKQFITTDDLERIIQNIPKGSPVFMGECGVCNERILSFKGPRINCPHCLAETEVHPLLKRGKDMKGCPNDD
jgi:hypothetical protein